MLNVVQLRNLSNFSLKVGTIVRDDLLWYSKPINDIILYKSGHMFGLQYGIRSYLYLLGEVVHHI